MPAVDMFAAAARLFAMDEGVWLRHASPWSVWTRVATLPVLLLALWSRVWFGWWALIPIAAACAWLWLNPRLFAPPARTDSWAAEATLGERIWLDRHARAIPAHHRVLPHVLALVAAAGFVLACTGALAGALWPTLLGASLTYAGKLWFCDRMVWLHRDVTGAAR